MTEPVRVARVSDQPLSVDRLLAAVNDPDVGGIVLFVGTVRNHDEPHTEQTVSALDYTAHPQAEERLNDVAARVAAAEGICSVAVEHRVGHLEIGDLAVVIAVGAAHRAEAFAGCRQLIEELKADVPIWKEQTFDDGVVQWVGL